MAYAIEMRDFLWKGKDMGKHSKPKDPTSHKIAVVAASVALGGAAVLTATGTAVADNSRNCPAGMTDTMFGCAKVTEYPDESRKAPVSKPDTAAKPKARENSSATNGSKGTTGTITSGPSSTSGGLIFRDEHGNDLGSGMGVDDQFVFIKHGPVGSGLIYVRQTTKGQGGWGSLYEGFVKTAYTMAPELFR